MINRLVTVTSHRVRHTVVCLMRLTIISLPSINGKDDELINKVNRERIGKQTEQLTVD